tara:strand:- start:192 stop:383 length:192 start_codon:yes stop_codon:yes gene_type:complete
MPSPRNDLTGIGSSRRPSAVDLGRGTGNNAEEILINEYMKYRAKVDKKKTNKFSGQAKEINTV